MLSFYAPPCMDNLGKRLWLFSVDKERPLQIKDYRNNVCVASTLAWASLLKGGHMGGWDDRGCGNAASHQLMILSCLSTVSICQRRCREKDLMDSGGIPHINLVHPHGFFTVSWCCYVMISQGLDGSHWSDFVIKGVWLLCNTLFDLVNP